MKKVPVGKYLPGIACAKLREGGPEGPPSLDDLTTLGLPSQVYGVGIRCIWMLPPSTSPAELKCYRNNEGAPEGTPSLCDPGH